MRDLFVDTLVSEKFAIKILARYFRVRPEDITHVTSFDSDNPIDIIFRNVRYDVKFSNPTIIDRDTKDKIWDFDIRGKKDYCDYLILIGMLNYRPMKLFLVPAKGAPLRHIRVSITGKSKWHDYTIWENK
jgi:hypothetical protein